jgi:hypothetical protein
MARYTILTPVPTATTDLGPVHFHQGKAEVDEIPVGVRQYCEQNGYTIIDTHVEAEQAADTDGVGDDDSDPVTPPPGNAKADVWRAHVLAAYPNKVTEEQLAPLNRDQLKDLAAQLAKEGDQQ